MAKKQPPRRRGRPELGDAAKNEALTVRFPPQMMREIEALQASRLDRPEKGALIRELIAEALQARAKRK